MDNRNHTVLLVEDDERLAQLVCEYLQRNGFNVEWERDGLQAEARLLDLLPDVLVLDIMLPGKDGLSICRGAREKFAGPILFLTARDEDFDQVLGLETGADDYVVKPIEPRVLLARIRALLRRYRPGPSSMRHEPSVKFGDLHINPGARLVTFRSEPVELSSFEFDLLLLLARRAGEVVKREELFKALHGRDYDGLDRSIDVRISHLRRKLGELDKSSEFIKTVWGRGYLFVKGD